MAHIGIQIVGLVAALIAMFGKDKDLKIAMWAFAYALVNVSMIVAHFGG